MSQATALVATAHPMSAVLHAAVLEMHGFNVASAFDGFEALDRACYDSPAVIVIDDRLPEPGAITVCTFLKSRPDTNAIPILVITESPDREYCQLLVGIGADQVLSQPCAGELLGIEAKRLAGS
jgi:CheY-like chemotaxis protein